VWHLQTAIDIYREVYGTDRHRNVIASVLNLGLLSLNNGDAKAARPYLERARIAAESALGPDHIYVATALDALGECELTLGRPHDAVALHRRALAIMTAKLGRENPRSASAMANLAEALRGTGELVAAHALFVEAIALLEATFGPSHEAVAVTRIDHGIALERMGKRVAARREIEAGLAILDAKGESRSAVVQRARGVLATLAPDFAATSSHRR
jgi:tetratricopeptide (TPR) repeat protein